MKILVKTTAALLVIGAYSSGGGMMAQSGPAQNVVLVHGAFADDSSWSKVMPLLRAKGFNVTAVGNPPRHSTLTSPQPSGRSRRRTVRRSWSATHMAAS
jgi:pimeloyl-ACP methyl ester carboxylesterase